MNDANIYIQLYSLNRFYMRIFSRALKVYDHRMYCIYIGVSEVNMDVGKMVIACLQCVSNRRIYYYLQRLWSIFHACRAYTVQYHSLWRMSPQIKLQDSCHEEAMWRDVIAKCSSVTRGQWRTASGGTWTGATKTGKTIIIKRQNTPSARFCNALYEHWKKFCKLIIPKSSKHVQLDECCFFLFLLSTINYWWNKAVYIYSLTRWEQGRIQTLNTWSCGLPSSQPKMAKLCEWKLDL